MRVLANHAGTNGGAVDPTLAPRMKASVNRFFEEVEETGPYTSEALAAQCGVLCSAASLPGVVPFSDTLGGILEGLPGLRPWVFITHDEEAGCLVEIAVVAAAPANFRRLHKALTERQSLLKANGTFLEVIPVVLLGGVELAIDIACDWDLLTAAFADADANAQIALEAWGQTADKCRTATVN